MKKYKLLSFLFLSSILLAGAQVDQKYLAGAVPETDGNVLFTKTFEGNPHMTKQQIYGKIQEWAAKEYKTEKDSKRRVLLEKEDESYIVCQGDDNLIFYQGALSIDKATITYHLLVKVANGNIVMEVRRIKYDYEDYKETQSAEDMITDKIALNKDGQKLNKHYDKFRTHTIDHIAAIENNLEAFLRANNLLSTVSMEVSVKSSPMDVDMTPLEKATPTTIDATPITSGDMTGYKRIEAEKLPINYIETLKEDWSLTISGKGDATDVMTSSWGGIGRLWQKPIIMSFIKPTQHSATTMNDGEYYTLSFYTRIYKDAFKYFSSTNVKDSDKIKGSGLTQITTPSGATAFSEAWLIIECKKILAQPISESAIMDKEMAKEWSKDGYHTIYVGEILNVWVK